MPIVIHLQALTRGGKSGNLKLIKGNAQKESNKMSNKKTNKPVPAWLQDFNKNFVPDLENPLQSNSLHYKKNVADLITWIGKEIKKAESRGSKKLKTK